MHKASAHPRSALWHGLALSLTVLALSGSARAQFSFEAPWTLQYDHPMLPAAYVIGDAKAVVLGQLTSDVIPDAAVLHGSDVHLIRSVDRRNQWRKLLGNYTGIALLPGAQQPSGRDGVLALGTSGLVKLLWDGSTGVETLVPQAVSGTPGWVGATSFQVVQSGAGTFEILALSANGRFILRGTFTSSTGAVALLTSYGLTLTCTSLVALDWDSHTGLEYAYGGNWGVQVISNAGLDIEPFDQACNRSLLARIPVVGGYDRLAWVFAPGGTADLLKVLREPDIQETPIWLLGASVAQMATADLGEDSRKELLLFGDSVPFMLGLRRGTTETFLDTTQFQYYYDLDKGNTLIGRLDSYPFDPGSGVLGGVDKAPVPAVMDLDGDGDDDIFMAGHPAGAARAMIYLGRRVDEEVFSSSQGDVVRAWIPSYTVTTSIVPDQAVIVFQAPDQPPSGKASTATHVQYTVWVQGENDDFIDQASAQVRLTALTSSGSVAPVVIGNLSGLDDGSIHIESTFLRMDTAGTVMLEAFPAYHEKLLLSWFTPGVQQTFVDGSAGMWGSPSQPGIGDGGVGGTSGRPPITPPSGGGG